MQREARQEMDSSTGIKARKSKVSELFLPEDPHHLSYHSSSGQIHATSKRGLSIYKGTSLSSYLYSELTRGYRLDNDEARFSEKRERVYAFIKIPWELERFMTYGFFQCLDTFLFVFTFLPIRCLLAVLKLLLKCLSKPFHKSGHRSVLEPAQTCDLTKGLVLASTFVIMQYVDVSMMYHIIRGQAIIKLYIFFNMLEVADRLFSSFGQDILDSLFWTTTEPSRNKRKIGIVSHFFLAVVYVCLHATLVLFQATTLNVAFNSHNKALLTIMMSNNFVELKGSVFKKFERNNLFQMSCSDVRERFHFVVLLTLISIRNLTEFSWDLEHLWVLIPDVVVVLISEVLVDWVKHAFITKFNEIPHEVYRDYVLSIKYDMVFSRQSKCHSDHMDLVSRRMGFIPLPLALVLARVLWQSLLRRSLFSNYLEPLLWILFYLCLVTLKIVNGIVLLGMACQVPMENHDSTAGTSEAAKQHEELLTPLLKRNSSDPMITSSVGSLPEEIGPAEEDKFAHLKRSQSMGGKMNVTFVVDSDDEPANIGSAKSAHLSHRDMGTVTPNLILANSTVSLQSVELNEEVLHVLGKETLQKSKSDHAGEKSEDGLKRANDSLKEVDRYTMCGNQIVS